MQAYLKRKPPDRYTFEEEKALKNTSQQQNKLVENKNVWGVPSPVLTPLPPLSFLRPHQFSNKWPSDGSDRPPR